MFWRFITIVCKRLILLNKGFFLIVNSIVGDVAGLQGGHTHSVVLNSGTYNTPLKQQHTIVKNKQDAFTLRGSEGRKTGSTGVPVTGAVLGSLASLGVGGALVFSGIKYRDI